MEVVKLARKKRRKKGKLTILKEKLGAIQKQVVLKLYGSDCYTCNHTSLVGSSCQLGHVPWPRSDLGPKARFEYIYTRIQCFHCNINLGGNGAKALQRMIDEGIDVRQLRAISDEEKGKVVPNQWYTEKIEEYKEKLRTLSVDNP